jgi:2-polyprenyl-3-methyl-5-hydroxy-6-metoxy-1,4-benzoquinol methylase
MFMPKLRGTAKRRKEKDAPSVSVHWRNLGRSTASVSQARGGWDSAALDWDKFVETGADYHRWRLHGRALLSAVGLVDGLKVLDLGCGQGWFSRQLARRGARVTGLDWSPKMIAMARSHEKRRPLGINYLRGDASRMTGRFPGESFDLVTSCMAFMDMPRIDKVLGCVSRLLRAKGRLVFSVSHPVNSSPGARWLRPRVGHHGPRLLDGYFDEGPYDILWKLRGSERVLMVPQWHRTFAEWFRLIGESGLVVTQLWEPRPTALQARRTPGLEGARRIPFYLIFEARQAPVAWT